MKKLFTAGCWLLLTVIITVLATGCSQRENPAMPETYPEGMVLVATHHYPNLEFLEDETRAAFSSRRVSAYVPRGYKLDVVGQRYPVLYLLPGYDGEPSFYYSHGNENYYQAASIAKVADRLIATGEIKPLIIIMPDASTPFGGSFYCNSTLEGPWENMMIDSLIAYIDRTYLTIAGKDSRAISGHSSGGYGAIRLAMKYPDMFNSVSCIDAPLAFTGNGAFGGITELFDDYLNESGITDIPSFYDADTLGFRAQPYKMLMYSMAGSFSPSGVMDPSTAFGKLRIDLPFDYEGNLISTTWDKWLAEDLYSWLDNSTYVDNLSGQHIYFETSDHDMNLFNEQTLLFQEKLTANGISFTSAQFEGYTGYEARSRSFLNDRIEFLLKFHNQYLEDRFEEWENRHSGN
ncbi:MAG: hypothetical protein KAT58_00540 [candidate division Zixibacteria bacterium]|nr:hypothetical protein [candidate division Zixibacteria bacterium]